MNVERKMQYTLEDVPKPFGKAFFLGAQHVLTMFGATVSVPLLLGPVMEMSPEQIALLVSAVMLASGVALSCRLTSEPGCQLSRGFHLLSWVHSLVLSVPSEQWVRP